MAKSSFDVSSVSPAALERAAEEAARRGQSVPEYFRDVLLSAMARAASAETVATSSTSEALAARRLETVKRRLGTASDSLEGAIEALDSTFSEIGARLSAVEAVSGAAAGAAAELNLDVNSFRSRLEDAFRAIAADGEDNAEAHADLAAACVMLSRRVEAAEMTARDAGKRAEAAAQANDETKRAAAEDFRAFAQDAAASLGAGLDEVRAAANLAAEQAEAAATHVVGELRAVRETLEARLAENAAETRARIQAVFADSSDRIAALSARVVDNERAHEQVRSRLTEVEDGLHAALEETDSALRRADAAVLSALARDRQATNDGLAALRNEMTGLKLACEAVSVRVDSESGQSELRQQLVEARGRIAKIEDEWETRFEALAARFQDATEKSAEQRRALRAETERVEACALAALEKLSADIATGDVALEARLQRAVRTFDETLSAVRQNVEETAKDAQRKHEGAAERLDRLSSAVSQLQADAAPLHERLTRVERLEGRAEAEQAAIIALAQRVGDLEQRQSSDLDALRAQITEFIGQNDERLAQLESGGLLGPDAMAEQFDDLRRRVEERIASVEQRSIRILEQVADTVQALDRRLSGAVTPSTAAKIA